MRVLSFLVTLDYSQRLTSDHLVVSLGRLFRLQLELSQTGEFFLQASGQCPTGLPLASRGCPTGHNLLGDHWRVPTSNWRGPVDLRVESCQFVYRIWLGFGINIFRHFNLFTILNLFINVWMHLLTTWTLRDIVWWMDFCTVVIFCVVLGSLSRQCTKLKAWKIFSYIFA